MKKYIIVKTYVLLIYVVYFW